MPAKSEVPSNQRDDSEQDNPLILPDGSPITLHKVNPKNELTPQTYGQTGTLGVNRRNGWRCPLRNPSSNRRQPKSSWRDRRG